MNENFHIYVVIMLHVGFAAAIRLWKGNENFSRLFAGAWLIEAIRATILLPEVHFIGKVYAREWFGISDALCFVATALLICSGAALVEYRISKKLLLAFFLVSIPTVSISRLVGPAMLQHWFQFSYDEANFWPVLFNLIVMFVPATVLRGVFAFWMFKIWRQTAETGAFIAFLFTGTYALVAIVVPIQFYFTWNPTWLKFIWCLRVFGFSMGMLMLIISRSEKVILDSTERLRTALSQLETTQQQAIGDERLKALGQMAAGVAHDINNSLTPLLNYSDLLRSRDDLDPAARDFARLINLGACDMSQTVKRLDHFYRKTNDREFLDSLDLAELVEQTIKLTKPKWQDQARANRKQIVVSTEIENRPQIRGDASLIRSVLMNLIFNSCEAIEEVGIIQVCVHGDENEGVVSVTDDGVGMNHEQLQRCMEPFYTSKTNGTGLGLSECHGIIRQHGGKIFVDSIPLGQTTVRFTLPIDDRSCTKRGAIANRGSVSEVVPRILFIDDDERVVRVARLLLETLPADVASAGEGIAALEILGKETFDFVLCDQGLPGMDGMSVLKEIKSRWPELPVVMVSGWALPKIADGPRPDGFIPKPFSMDSLCSGIREVLQRRRSRASS